MKPLRIAFNMIGGRNWAGGYNYLLNLVGALSRLRGTQITPVMLFGCDVSEVDAAPFERMANVEVIRDAAFDATRQTESTLKALILGRDGKKAAMFERAKIDVIFENAQFNGWRLRQPVIAWMPDFQHRLMPHLFSRAGFWRREVGFRVQVASDRTVLLSSHDSRESCEAYYPSSVGRTHVVHFTVPQPASVDHVSARQVADSYGLPERFFFMPNQFWQHKNHALVIDALARLKQVGRSDLVVVSTGRTADPRLPEHFPALADRVRSLGLTEQFRILGMVPYVHVSALMHVCDGLLNPSLFEGWSTTVEEARAMGIPMLLSDLPVHREQAAGCGQFFDPRSEISLAKAMVEFPPRLRLDPSQLAREADVRMEQFVDSFVAIVQRAMERSHVAAASRLSR